MYRLRLFSVAAAVATLALTAGIATAHLMPAASDAGRSTARDASGHDVPMGVDGSFTDTTQPSNPADPAAGSHGSTVSQAAQGPTPSDGGWANHGAYVSSIAKGWGQQNAAARPSAAPSPEEPAQATDGLSHRP
jgi:hypothetical protein